jgi:zinc transport system substrate-binding protein
MFASMRRIAFGAILVLSGPAWAAEPHVVVTMKPIHSLATRVMDGVATPKLIVDGAASPHTFTLKPSQARAINAADVFIRVSESVEPFTRKLVSALPKTVRVVTLAEADGITLLAKRSGGTFEDHDHHHGHGHGHKHGKHKHDHDHGAKSPDKAASTDGHIWLDPGNGAAIVNVLVEELSGVYPMHSDRFRKNGEEITAELQAMAKDIEAELEPVKGRPFIVFHDAYQYFENRFGMPAAGSITLSPDVQPSAKRLTAVRKRITELGPTCVFAEPGFKPRLLSAVTEGTAARTGVLDGEGLAIEAGRDAYVQLLRGLSRDLKACLEG